MKIEVLPPYEPLVNARALAQFQAITEPHFDVFEYGSGKSTVWFAQHCAHIVTVENDIRWYQAVANKLLELELYAMMHLVAFKNDERGAQQRAEEYAAVIDAFPDECFDIVFVDGKARPHCIRDGRVKVKPDGWMVVDDTHWKPVRDALHFLDGWPSTQYRGIVHGAIDGLPRNNTTGFYRKPSEQAQELLHL